MGAAQWIAVVACLAATMGIAGAQGKGQGRGRGNSQSRAAGPGFSLGDRQMIWDYYGANPALIPPAVQALPPGLAKRVQRGEPLPPGWQKKIAALPGPLDARLPPLPNGYRRVVVDRWAFVIANATNAVMDVVDLIRR